MEGEYKRILAYYLNKLSLLGFYLRENIVFISAMAENYVPLVARGEYCHSNLAGTGTSYLLKDPTLKIHMPTQKPSNNFGTLWVYYCTQYIYCSTSSIHYTATGFPLCSILYCYVIMMWPIYSILVEPAVTAVITHYIKNVCPLSLT